jgi:hypothetical protein
MTQQAFTAILQHLVNEGRAPHYTELAGILGVPVTEARQLQHDAADAAVVGTFFSSDTETIGAWPPFSNVPSLYRISVDGEQKWYAQ